MTIDRDALRNLTKSQLEELQAAISKELVACGVCGGDMAERFRVRTGSRHPVMPGPHDGSILLCPACWHKLRTPDRDDG